jgi:hypothetical protein
LGTIILKEFLLWSETWAFLIPIGVWAFRKTDMRTMNPVLAYAFTGFILFFAANFSWRMKARLDLPNWFEDNNFLYNILSVIRVLLFTRYMKQQDDFGFRKWYPATTMVYVALLLINFSFLESFLKFSNNAHIMEVIYLLLLSVYTLIIYLRSDSTDFMRKPVFWVMSGLLIYEAVNLFVFGIYAKIAKTDAAFAFRLWDVHNVSHVVLCILMAKAFYVSGKR